MIKEFKINAPEGMQSSINELACMGFTVTSTIIDRNGENILDSDGSEVFITKYFNMIESVTLLSYIMELEKTHGVDYNHSISYSALW